MATAPFKLREDYWESFELEPQDLEFIYNHLLDLETPLTTRELMIALVLQRIFREKQALQNRQLSDGTIYTPKDHYQTGQVLLFPALSWQKGKVVNIRSGHNPEYGSFKVLEMDMEIGGQRHFASGLLTHKLNQPIEISLDDPLLSNEFVINSYGDRLVEKLDTVLKDNLDLVRIAARWFPRALLVDVNIGHLNLAEAALDMAGGGPLSTKALLEQIDLPTDVNAKLTEFSLNFALQEDPRFDEVGPSGEVIWFLERLEPEAVRQTPIYLQYPSHEYDSSKLDNAMLALERQLDDDLSDLSSDTNKSNDVVVSLTYPHWRAGTIPLTNRTNRLFPTAFEAPRIQFNLVDSDSGEKFPGWVVRPGHYVFGLRDWYVSQGLIPGSLIHIHLGKNAGEVIVQAEKRRSNREWIRTILVGADGGIVFAMLKQMVTAAFDERMAIAIPDVKAIDQVWDTSLKQHTSLLQSTLAMMRELAKLTPQGHVHAQELYAALNVIRRCPPAPLFSLLSTQPIFVHVGDLHYRLDEAQQEK
jgi:hypothetical protein